MKIPELTRFQTNGNLIEDFGRIPFGAPGDKDEGRKNTKHRLKVVREFIGYDIKNLKTLDIGQSNRFGRELGIKHNTLDYDLNQKVEAPDKDYDLILFSEIPEHMMNLYYVMVRIYDLLRPGGVCIFSTPLMTWNGGIAYQSPHHFVEYRADRLGRFFHYMGFEIVKWEKYRLWDLDFIFWGIRPILRVLFHRNQVWMIRKPDYGHTL